MRQTFTLTAWQAIRIGPYREAEYACNYFYENGKCVGSSKLLHRPVSLIEPPTAETVKLVSR